MKTQTFGIIIGVIVVAWLAAMFFLGWSRWQELDAKQEDAKKTISKLKKLSKKKPEDFPSDELREAVEKYREDYSAEYDSALGFFESRKEKYHEYITGGSRRPNAEEWGTKQQDLLSLLREDYEKSGRDSQELKFTTGNDLDENQTRWTTFQTIVKAVIAADGSLTDSIRDDKLKGLTALEADPYFSRREWEVQADLPPKNVPTLLSSLLANENVLLEVAELTVAKAKGRLIMDLVQTATQSGAAFEPPPLEEPAVRVKLILHALDFTYEKPKAADEEEEG
ncbi:MAG: hypothetical protein AAF581_06445 [Planctomycetota bacterium]